MSDNLLKLYHRLPGPLRSVVASLRGYQLRRWRYGRETEQLVQEALAREHWDADQWRAWHEQRLPELLHTAATRVPYYRQKWAERRRRGDQSAWDELQNWPILTKQELRESSRHMLVDGADKSKLWKETTSGTTGVPVTLWGPRELQVAWYALFEARWRRWYGVSRSDRWAIIGGQRVVPFAQSRPPFWVWNRGLNQLYLSSLHARPDFLDAYLDALRKYSVVYLLGYSSTIYWLAQRALETGQVVPLKVVLTNAEPLYDFQRTAIEKAFNCPVRETYGQAEMVCAMSECEHGRLHLWPDVGITELLDEEGQSVVAGQRGRLVCTRLLDDTLPLIRYDTMDLAELPAHAMPCACGRSLPPVERVIGRCDDAITTRDGRRFALLDIIFEPDMPLREAQIIQESFERIRVKVVPTAEWNSASSDKIRTALWDRMGHIEVVVEIVAEIPRTWAGKFRMLISHVTPYAGHGHPAESAQVAEGVPGR